MSEKKKTQRELVLDLLIDRGSAGITPIDALREVRSFRLAAQIHELRKLGHDIVTEDYKTPNGAHVARYVLRPKFVARPLVGTPLQMWLEV